MLIQYKTVFEEAQAEIIEKKSRFIAYVSPAESEEDAISFIEQIRKKNYNATHNVYAYRIGERNQYQKCSDDGEPSGTAGLPILNILQSEDIKNIVVVVTRYFGGTLLGTGGLVRAYSKSAKEGIQSAKIVEKILYQQFNITTDYNTAGKLQYQILQNGHILKDTLYTDKVQYIVLVEYEKKDIFQKEIIEISNATAQIETCKTKYGTKLESELIF